MDIRIGSNKKVYDEPWPHHGAVFKTVRLIQVPLPYWCISTRNRFEVTILKSRVTVAHPLRFEIDHRLLAAGGSK
jgi:hypothetical protein